MMHETVGGSWAMLGSLLDLWVRHASSLQLLRRWEALRPGRRELCLQCCAVDGVPHMTVMQGVCMPRCTTSWPVMLIISQFVREIC